MKESVLFNIKTQMHKKESGSLIEEKRGKCMEQNKETVEQIKYMWELNRR